MSGAVITLPIAAKNNLQVALDRAKVLEGDLCVEILKLSNRRAQITSRISKKRRVLETLQALIASAELIEP